MERAKAERTVARRRFSLCAKKLEIALNNKDKENTLLEFKKLSAFYSDLSTAQNKVLSLWLDNEQRDEALFEQDIDEADEYLSKWFLLESKAKEYVEHNNSESVSKHTCTVKEVSELSGHKRHFRLPKLELPTFNGEIKKWLSFWTQFKKIHCDPSIDKDDKFQYLLQCMELGSSARELIESYPPSGENYDNAVAQLKLRFAKDELIIEHYVRELLQLVLAQARGTQKMSTRSLYDKIITQVMALESMGVSQDKYAAFLYPLVESALPEDILRAWNRSHFCSDDSNPLTKLLQFIKKEVESEERIRLSRSGFSANLTAPAIPSTSCFTTSDKQSLNKGSYKNSENVAKPCLFCEKTTHTSSECVTAVNKNFEERVEIVKLKKACGICLNTGHHWKRCRKHPKCVICGKRHFPIMCSSTKHKLVDEKVSSAGEPVNITQSISTIDNKTVLLQTLKVKLVCNSSVLSIRVLLDSGAQRSFIKTDVVNKLNLKPICSQELSHNLFGGSVIKKQLHRLYNVNIYNLDNTFSCNLDVLEQNVICGCLPQLRSGELWSRLQNLGICITDCTDDISDIGMLIGSDILGSLFTGRAVRVDDNLFAVETKLGWTVQGPVDGGNCSVNNVYTLSCTFNLEDFWKLETMGIKDETKSQKRIEAEVMKFFEETIHVNSEDRYEVKLPWKDASKPLQPNYDMALKRLTSTTSRLKKIGILNDYSNVFQEWLQDGIIEEVENDDPTTGHYLPHHAVVKDSSLTTKIRPVFDASSKDFNGLSLNMSLEKGLNLVEMIPKLLMNFRRNAIGITSDIKKAFLQISVYPEDRNFLKFLWWHDINENKFLRTYRHQRVVFGVTTSPYLLSATILHHLRKYNCQTATLLSRSFYIDNCVVSVKNKDEMNEFIEKAKNIMLQGKFELRGWVTGPIITDKDKDAISVLGVIWDPYKDTLFCNIPSIDKCLKNGFTKRNVLSLTQSIFDPLGFLSPVTIVPKNILQKCWILNLEWDQSLPQELRVIIEDWARQIHILKSCHIPRRISHADLDESNNSLHIFCDASQYAYACCIYLRSEHCNEVSVHLVLAKSRVAPTKRVTMPRLELIAALLATRLMSQVREGFELKCKEFYWSDSSIVLAWLKRKAGLSVFVQNRVSEILQHSNLEDWQHIPGDKNPADLPSRGCSPKKLSCSEWWLGPEWLSKPSQDWPIQFVEPDQTEVLKEIKKNCTVVNNVNFEKFSERLTYFGKYTKIVRVIGWCFRFIYNCQNKSKKVDDISAKEYIKAEKSLLHLLQNEDITNLTLKHQTFRDGDNLLRVKTRLSISDNCENFVTPILLSAKNVIVERLAVQKHVELLHAGSQTLINSLRENYWILGIRRLTKRIVRRCVTCRRFSAKACTVPPAPLPFDRINCGSVFEVTGVDLAGPLFLKSKNKCWVILFTCAVYRAIHLELTTSLSTEDFMLALRRFLARRGNVRIIYSDNGTNLRGANNILSTTWQELAKKLSVQKIEWRFIPPSAPWWGGFWERMVRTLKEIMRRILGKAALQENELYTVLCEVETVINLRPLTYIADNTEYLRPLCPMNFLSVGGTGNNVDFMDHVDGNILTSRWRYLNAINLQLKERFRSEYLSLLTAFADTKNIVNNLCVGDIVLIGSDDVKRVNWPLGLILEIFTGTDGHSRVARVKTSSGERVRALQRLYRLELSCNDALLTNKKETPTVTRAGRVIRVPPRFGEV